MKRKIVQIESIYPKFAGLLYKKFPDLGSKGFECQVDAILKSGWSGGQNIVPYLNPQKWDRHYLIPTLAPVQLAWVRDRHCDKKEIGARAILRAQLDLIEPDVIYITDIGAFDFSILDELKRRPLIVAWLASRFPNSVHWGKIDLLLSGIDAIRNEALRRGVRAVSDFNSAAPSFQSIKASLLLPESSVNSLVFSGSFFPGYHDQRALMLMQVAVEVPAVSIDIYTENSFPISRDSSIRFKPPVFGSEVIQTYSRYPLVVDARADFGLNEIRFNRDTSNMRIFEATRAGSLLVTEYAPNLEVMFDIGKEIICYKSEGELFEHVSFYLSDRGRKDRESIAVAGFQRTIKCHTIEQRALQFDSLITRLM
jgi:spore maturation protein CgeB